MNQNTNNEQSQSIFNKPNDVNVKNSQYDNISLRQKLYLEHKDRNIFDAKKLFRFKYMCIPSDSYYEELFLPRLSSPYRYTILPSLYSVCSGLFGIGMAIQRDKSKLRYFFKYAGFGALVSVPFFAINEVTTGLWLRETQKENFVVSSFIAGGFMFSLVLLGTKGKISNNLINHTSRCTDMVLPLIIYSMWAEVIL